MAIVELTNEEINKYIDELYACFPTGREFEIFLNSFLTTLYGLSVTLNYLMILCEKKTVIWIKR